MLNARPALAVVALLGIVSLQGPYLAASAEAENRGMRPLAPESL